MRVPSESEKNMLLGYAQAGNEEKLQELIETVGLPEEVASRWYAYLAEASDISTTQQVSHLLDKAW